MPTTPTHCSAAESGQGYWTCDQTGGCADCRRLARSAEDYEMLREWKHEAEAAAETAADDAAAMFTLVGCIVVDTEAGEIL